MSLEDLFGMLIPVTYLFMLVTEQIMSGRSFPHIRWWKVTGALFVITLMSISIVLPLLLPSGWIREHSLFAGDRLGILGGAIIGYLANTLFQYFFHRAEHRFPFLWKWLHQLHHSPQRVDISGAAFTHPFEMIAMTLISVLVTIFILGLDPVAVALTGFIGAFYSMFQHWNIKTPHWLGYLIERPESHCLHHDRHDIRYNYSDLPLWDIVFGTFKNPETFTGEVGYDDEKARLIIPMLMGKDVHQPNLLVSQKI